MRTLSFRYPLKLLSILCITAFMCLGGVTMTGCSAQGYVSAERVEPLFREVRTRHDRYVRADQALSQTEKDSYLTSTELIQSTFDEALRTPTTNPAAPTTGPPR